MVGGDQEGGGGDVGWVVAGTRERDEGWWVMRMGIGDVGGGREWGRGGGWVSVGRGGAGDGVVGKGKELSVRGLVLGNSRASGRGRRAQWAGMGAEREQEWKEGKGKGEKK